MDSNRRCELDLLAASFQVLWKYNVGVVSAAGHERNDHDVLLFDFLQNPMHRRLPVKKGGRHRAESTGHCYSLGQSEHRLIDADVFGRTVCGQNNGSVL